MEKIRIGVICPSEIAYRRFMPALAQCSEMEYIGVAIAAASEWDCKEEVRLLERKKADNFAKNYGGLVFESYTSLIASPEIDAIYMPLPPALHFEWARRALENGKHVFIEKPSTTQLAQTKELVCIARNKKLALHENYMFQYHSQINDIQKRIQDGLIGDIRLYRIAFGFPQRDASDFRYNKALGGGALLDCGGYTVRLASMLLGDTAKITAAQLNYTAQFSVDIYGSATMQNDEGTVAQLSFGMDNAYKCEAEIWGSKGVILADRVFTAPAGFSPNLRIKVGNEPEQMVSLPADDSFLKSIAQFALCVKDEATRDKTYQQLICQANLIQQIGGK